MPEYKLGETIGVETPDGNQFFKVVKGGLDGPYIDEGCNVPFMSESLREEIDRNAGAQRHYVTGKRRRNKEYTTTDGTQYKTNNNGSLVRLTPKLSKKERRRAKEESRQQSSAAAEAVQQK